MGSESRWNLYWEDREGVNPEDTESWHNLVWHVNLGNWLEIFRKLSPGRKLLEYGCGSATLSQYMSIREYDCTMLDFSPNAIQVAKKQFEEKSLSGKFIIGDIERLCIPDNHFDIVFSGGVLEYFDVIQDPINEVIRVLKPGGLFALNVVPNKFSCQTLANFQRTIAWFFRDVWRGDFKKPLKIVNHIPSGVSRARLSTYMQACQVGGLHSVSGFCNLPFPSLSLGESGNKTYVKFMKKLLPYWRKFDQSNSKWTEVWGTAYTIYGIKN